MACISIAFFAGSVVTFNALLHFYKREGDVAAAGEILRLMAREGIAADAVTYNTLLSSHARNGDVAGANGIMQVGSTLYYSVPLVITCSVYERTKRDTIYSHGSVYTML